MRGCTASTTPGGPFCFCPATHVADFFVTSRLVHLGRGGLVVLLWQRDDRHVSFRSAASNSAVAILHFFARSIVRVEPSPPPWAAFGKGISEQSDAPDWSG